MSWGTCYSGSNNIHNEFPPFMADGRLFTTWLHDNTVSELIKKNNNFKSNSEYRHYLVKNSDSIIDNNRNNAYKNCCSYLVNYKENSTHPYLYTSHGDNSQPYGYSNSDLKNMYLSRQKLQSQSVTPFVTEETLSKYANV